MADVFDVIVIGGGHGGAEAAHAAARLGARTALVTFSADAIGRLSCNPSIGGIGKGQIVREIDALGGLMGRVADEAGIQFRMLNRRKGPAVWAPRAQVDADVYPRVLQRYLQACPNLTIVEGGVEEVLTAGETPAPPCETPAPPRAAGLWPNAVVGAGRRVTGVRLVDGRVLQAPAVVLATGTFLRGLMHTGAERTVGGRIDEPAATGLSAVLAGLGLRLGRLKTGTPPRLDRATIDLDALEQQPGDEPPAPFSFLTERIEAPQVPCWITYTTPGVHEVIRANLDRAPLYTGQIESIGPRYCPSIETKVVRFADKARHQVFLEPETRDGERVYPNGISTSLPRDVQERVIRGMAGLERARIVQWGYAIEYDFVWPEQVDATLMTRGVTGLFLAGQILGTTGYEEAAGLGLLAGVNAARLVAGSEPVILGRDQAYLGVMVDDLVTRGVTEPYRMFTSRAEYRLHLRYDNADSRLTPVGRALGLVDNERWERFERHQGRVQELLGLLDRVRHEGRTLRSWLQRPEEDGRRFAEWPALAGFVGAADVWGRALVEVKYAGYVEREARQIERFRELEDRLLPADMDYRAVRHLRHEARERLEAVRPRSLGQAARVSGIHPADVTVLMVELASRERARNQPVG